MGASDDDVRVQQAVLRAARALLRAALQAARGRARRAARSISARVRFPGLISARDDAVGRHVRLRAGDDARGGERGAVCVLRPARHAHSVHGDARRRRGAADAGGRAARTADAHGLQRRAPSIRRPRRSATSVLEAFPARAASTGRSTSKRQGIVDSWPADVDDSRRAPRLGLRAALRFRARVRRLPVPDDPGALLDHRVELSA